MDTTNLAKRMKRYELSSKSFLTRRTPVIIRLDGKAFHTLTKGFQKPFDPILGEVMQRVTQRLCEEIQGCVFGYTQSDEITLVLVDYKTLTSNAWFDYNLQKLASVSASLATRYFILEMNSVATDGYASGYTTDELLKYFQSCLKVAFDSRCFNIPIEEVCNNLIWRQQDAMRNSVQLLGQANFSHKELQNKSCKKIKEMLLEKDIVWENLATCYQRGSACIRDIKGNWIIDKDTPIFQEDRNYIERNIVF